MKRHLVAVLGLAFAMPAFASYDNIDAEILAVVDIENSLQKVELYIDEQDSTIYNLEEDGSHSKVDELFSGEHVTSEKDKEHGITTGGVIITVKDAATLRSMQNHPSVAEFIEVSSTMVIMQFMPDLNLMSQVQMILQMPGVISVNFDYSEHRDSMM